jgi:hypothetical protein
MKKNSFLNEQLPDYLLIVQAKEEFESLIQEELTNLLEKYFKKCIKKPVPRIFVSNDNSEGHISVWSDFTSNSYGKDIEWISLRVCWNSNYLNGKPFANITMEFKDTKKFDVYCDDEVYKYRNQDDEHYEFESLGTRRLGILISEPSLNRFANLSLVENIKAQLAFLCEKTIQDLEDFSSFLKAK